MPLSDNAQLSLRLLMGTFAGGELPEWDRVAETAELVRIQPGESLFRQGEAHPFVYLLWRGLIKMHVSDPVDATLAFHEENRVVAPVSAVRPAAFSRIYAGGRDPIPAELSATMAGRCEYSATALEESEAVRLDATMMEELVRRHSMWAQTFLTLLYAQLVHATHDRYRLCTLSPEAHYRYLLKARPSLLARLKQREVALYLGLSEAGMSRIVKRVRADTAAER